MSNTNNNETEIETEPIFGFYSEKQKNKREKNIYYLNMNDEVVQVTEVSHNEDTNSKFDDFIKLGKLNRYIPNFYIENYGFKYEDFKDKMLK
mgnify:CR=1 FL=1